MAAFELKLRRKKRDFTFSLVEVVHLKDRLEDEKLEDDEARALDTVPCNCLSEKFELNGL